MVPPVRTVSDASKSPIGPDLAGYFGWRGMKTCLAPRRIDEEARGAVLKGTDHPARPEPRARVPSELSWAGAGGRLSFFGPGVGWSGGKSTTYEVWDQNFFDRQ